jgi:hypothetical protein
MTERSLLLIDAAINLVLGLVLILLAPQAFAVLGVPQTDTLFYPHILGAVLVGIGLALIIQWRRRPGGLAGLGLGGAIAINLCGGLALAAWLVFGGLALPLRGFMFLWGLVCLLVGISVVELVAQRKAGPET